MANGKCHVDGIFQIMWRRRWHLAVCGRSNGISQIVSDCNGADKIYSLYISHKTPVFQKVSL